MYKVFFVILHYKNINDTINCINSIKKMNKHETAKNEIIVIDNKSPNNTGKELENKYKEDEDIKVILLDKNYGFSKANNIAYEYCKKKNADLIIMLNNDILIEDTDFMIKLCEFYDNNASYEIICPDIINLDNNHQNPMRTYVMPIKNAYKNMIYRFVLSLLMYIPILNKYIYKFEVNREQRWLDNYYKNGNSKEEFSYFVPFGAFIIFTKSWINKENFAFPSDTFMYMEEDMLSSYIAYKNYNITYLKQLQVKHLEGRSTESRTNNKYKNCAFKYRNRAKALYKYIKFIRKIRKENKI